MPTGERVQDSERSGGGGGVDAPTQEGVTEAIQERARQDVPPAPGEGQADPGPTAPGNPTQIDRITDPTGQSGTPEPPGEVLSQQELADRGISYTERYVAAREAAERTPGLEQGEVRFREAGGQVQVGAAPEGDVSEDRGMPLELERAFTTGRIEQAKRETTGAGFGRFPGAPTAEDLQAQEAVRSTAIGSAKIQQAKEATVGAGVGLSPAEYRRRQFREEAIEDAVSEFNQKYTVGFEVGDEFTVADTEEGFRLNLTPTGRRRLLETEAVRPTSAENAELGEATRTLDFGGLREIEYMDTLKFGPEGNLKKVDPAPGYFQAVFGPPGGIERAIVGGLSGAAGTAGSFASPVVDPVLGTGADIAVGIEQSAPVQAFLGPTGPGVIGDLERGIGSYAANTASGLGMLGEATNELLLESTGEAAAGFVGFGIESAGSLLGTPKTFSGPLAQYSGGALETAATFPGTLLQAPEKFGEAAALGASGLEFTAQELTEEGVPGGLATTAAAATPFLAGIGVRTAREATSEPGSFATRAGLETLTGSLALSKAEDLGTSLNAARAGIRSRAIDASELTTERVMRALERGDTSVLPKFETSVNAPTEQAVREIRQRASDQPEALRSLYAEEFSLGQALRFRARQNVADFGQRLGRPLREAAEGRGLSRGEGITNRAKAGGSEVLDRLTAPGEAAGYRAGYTAGRAQGITETAGLRTGRVLGQATERATRPGQELGFRFGYGFGRAQAITETAGLLTGRVLGRAAERATRPGEDLGYLAGIQTGRGISRLNQATDAGIDRVSQIRGGLYVPSIELPTDEAVRQFDRAVGPAFDALGRGTDRALEPARRGATPFQVALDRGETLGAEAGRRAGRYVRKAEEDADLDTEGPDELLLRSESEPLPEDFEAREGEFELPGLFASPDLSPLRLGSSGGLSAGLELRLPRIFSGGEQVTSFTSQRIDAMPEDAAGFGYAVRGPDGDLVEQNVGAETGREIAEEIGGQRVPDPDTSGYEFLTEVAEPGTAYVRPPWSRKSELEAIYPPESRYRQVDEFAVRTPEGGRTPAAAFEYVGRGEPEDVLRQADEAIDEGELLSRADIERRRERSRATRESAPAYPPLASVTEPTSDTSTSAREPSAELTEAFSVPERVTEPVSEPVSEPSRPSGPSEPVSEPASRPSSPGSLFEPLGEPLSEPARGSGGGRGLGSGGGSSGGSGGGRGGGGGGGSGGGSGGGGGGGGGGIFRFIEGQEPQTRPVLPGPDDDSDREVVPLVGGLRDPVYTDFFNPLGGGLIETEQDDVAPFPAEPVSLGYIER